MSAIATALKHMLAAGMPHDAIVAAVAEMEAVAAPARTARQERNARYYAKKASETRLNASEQDGSDVSDASPHSLPPSPQTPQPPTHTPVEVTTRARPTALDKPNGFARFWEAYPNKVAKPAAEKAYAKACREIDDPDPPGVLLDGLERAKRCRQWVDGYIPHPTTWLNQGRWADQPAEITTQKANPHDRPRQNPGNDREARRGVWAEVLAEERGEGIGDLARAG